MKFFTDLLPILAFFIVYKKFDIFYATAAAIIITFLQVLYSYLTSKKVEKVQIINLVVILVFGGMTILFQNETYSVLASDDYKLLSSSAYFMNEPHRLHLFSDNNTRPSHYNLWNRLETPTDNILYITYSNNEISDSNLACTFIRSVDIYTRKQLTLYNCTSK